jgi:hypothetical protein
MCGELWWSILQVLCIELYENKSSFQMLFGTSKRLSGLTGYRLLTFVWTDRGWKVVVWGLEI